MCVHVLSHLCVMLFIFIYHVDAFIFHVVLHIVYYVSVLELHRKISHMLT